MTSVNPKPEWTAQIDTELVFRLIDGILPFEACLYHQIIPLSLEGSRLRLGMVNLDDSAALDYVRRILAYMNCSLAPQTIPLNTHHAILTAYLNYTGSQSKANKPQLPSVAKAAKSSKLLATEQPSASEVTNRQPPLDDRGTAPTLLVDSPDQLSFIGGSTEVSALSTPESSDSVSSQEGVDNQFQPNHPPPDSPQTDHAEHVSPPSQSQLQSTLILEPHAPSPPEISAAAPLVGGALPELEVEPRHLSEPVEVLATLPPDQLLEELLGRVLVGGIGRLYFERQPSHGRILWSQNGVLQSVLEGLPLDTLQGVVDELKHLTRLPLTSLQQPQQVELERLYQKQRLLLRLRVMPGSHGEEATLQVLRGAALKFYQQQQIFTLGRDALSTAQNLQHTINELRSRTASYPALAPEQLGVLPLLDEVIKNVEQQLEALKSLQANSQLDE